MHDTATTIREWLDDGRDVAFARVINRSGFSGDNELELLACNEQGDRAGDLLRGTVVDDSLAALRQSLADPARGTTVVSAHVAMDQAVGAGLSCGGSAQVLVQSARRVPSELWSALAADRPVVLATAIGSGGAQSGAVVVLPGQAPLGTLGSDEDDDSVSSLANKLLAGGLPGSESVETDCGTVLVEAFIPEPRVIVAGSGSLAEAIAAQAGLLGWSSRVTARRDETGEALRWAGGAGALVVLSHDVDFGPDALFDGLRSEAFYLGALGSRRTQANRRTRLSARGVSEQELARIHGPVGLDLGGRTPPQVALAICAEILAVRTGRAAAQLRETSGPIRQRPAGEPSS